MYLIFDTETTGLPKRWKAPITDSDNWPRCVQIAWQLHDAMGQCIEHQDYLIRPDGFNIPYDAEQIHGISTALATKEGEALAVVLEKFNTALAKAKFVVGQNVGFDLNIMGCEYHRMQVETPLNSMPVLDTCTETTASLCQLPGGRGGKFKLPTLTELHQKLFDTPFAEAHNATADVEATTRCFLELLRQGIYTADQLQAAPDYVSEFQAQNLDLVAPLGLKHVNLKKAAAKLVEQTKKQKETAPPIAQKIPASLTDANVVHLHNHSQFSILQSTISIKKLVKATANAAMPAVALTDHGNMMGAFHFVKEIGIHNKALALRKKDAEAAGEVFNQKPIKPIVGCEFFVCEDHSNKSQKDNGYQMVFLAKNKKGYQNLVKMSSLAFTDGFYYVPPRSKTMPSKSDPYLPKLENLSL